MQTPNLPELAEQLKPIIRAAGAAIMRIYEQKNSWSVVYKSDNSPVTAADQAANELIGQALNDLYPQIPIISEENAEISYQERQHFPLCWVIDPLDGTKEFISQNPEFSVNIALIEQNTVVAGWVYLPAMNTLYYAYRNGGAFMEKDGQNPSKIQANTVNLSQSGLKIARSRNHFNQETQKAIDKLQQPELIVIGASLKFLHIANGKLDFYPRYGVKMNEWDVAANQIIVEEAGGAVLNPRTGQKLAYNQPDLRIREFLAVGKLANPADIEPFLG